MPNTVKNILQGSTGNTLRGIAFNTDGSVKTDLEHNTSGISVVVQRIGMADSTALTLSAKSGTTWAAGAFLNLGGGDISIDIADSFFASPFLGEIRVYGTFTGGFVIGEWYGVVGYDPSVPLDQGLVRGVVGSGSSTTSISVASVESGLAVADQLKGRVLIFNKNTTTVALRGQGAPVAGNSLSEIAVAAGDAFTTSPVAGDTFTIY